MQDRCQEETEDKEMNDLDAIIEEHAERALREIKIMGAIARKRIRRMAEFPARSEGQKRRFAAIKQGETK